MQLGLSTFKHKRELPCVNADKHCLKNIYSNCDRSVDSVTMTQANTKTLCELGIERSDIATIAIN